MTIEPMASWIPIAQLVLLGLMVVLLLWLALRRTGSEAAERLERNLRGDVQDSARGTRQELASSLSAMQQALLTQSGDVARTQNEQIDSFRTQLAAMQQGLAEQTRAAREAQDAALHRFGQAQAEQLRSLGDGNDKRMAEVRQTVETKLTAIQADNAPAPGADARDGRREVARHARTAPGRKLQAGRRSARAGAQGPGRDAVAGARRRLAQPQC